MGDLFEINMSRNKFIKFLHRKSDKSFSELRSILKKNKWNMSDTYLELFMISRVKRDDR